MIIRKTAAELEKMRRSGILVYQILKNLGDMVQEGVSTYDLEVAAERMIADAGARPAFRGYFVLAAGERSKYVLCTSVNSGIVHGIPAPKAVWSNGDIVADETGVQLVGYYGDSGVT